MPVGPIWTYMLTKGICILLRMANTCYICQLFPPGDFPWTSSKMILNQSPSRLMQNFGSPFHVWNVLMMCIIFFDLCKRFICTLQIDTRSWKKLQKYLILYSYWITYKSTYTSIPTRKIAYNETWETAKFIKLFSFSFTTRTQGHSWIKAHSIWFVHIFFYWQQFNHGQGLFSPHLSVYILEGNE